MKSRALLAVGIAAASFASHSAVAAEPIRVPSVQVTLIDDVTIPAREAGVLLDVNIRVGSMVKKGETLARIDDTKAKLAETQASIELDIATVKSKNDVKVRFAKKSRQVADAELRRAVESDKRFKGIISESQMDVLRLTAERAALAVEEANRELKLAGMSLKLKETLLKTAKADVEMRRIVTSVGGMVVEVKRRPGEWVEPGQSAFRVVRLDRLRVKGFVKTTDVRGNLIGRSVTVVVSLPGARNATFPGTVTFISPEVDPNNGEVAVWAEIQNTGSRLRPGLRGSMTIGSRRR